VLADADTGLAAPFVFYFGNQIGSTGTAPNAKVTAIDLNAVVNNAKPSGALITNPYDINRDGKVTAIDVSDVVNHAAAGTAIKFFTPTDTTNGPAGQIASGGPLASGTTSVLATQAAPAAIAAPTAAAASLPVVRAASVAVAVKAPGTAIKYFTPTVTTRLAHRSDSGATLAAITASAIVTQTAGALTAAPVVSTAAAAQLPVATAASVAAAHDAAVLRIVSQPSGAAIRPPWLDFVDDLWLKSWV